MISPIFDFLIMIVSLILKKECQAWSAVVNSAGMNRSEDCNTDTSFNYDQVAIIKS
jgi:hypothetical protein